MKRTLSILLSLTLSATMGCHRKPTARSLDDFDMHAFCDRYTVLNSVQASELYILRPKEGTPGTDIFLWKDYDYKGSGYGYIYSNRPLPDDALANGVSETAAEAVKKAQELLPAGQRSAYLMSILPIGNGDWMTFGNRYHDICGGQ